MKFRISRKRFSHMGAFAKQKRSGEDAENTRISHRRFCTHVTRIRFRNILQFQINPFVPKR